MNKKYDIIIIGGGVNGCAAAFNLSKLGYKVLLLEKDQIGSKASNAAAGMLGAQVELTEAGPLFELARSSRSKFPALQEELKEFSGIDIELVQKGMLKVARTDKEVVHLKQIIEDQRNLGEETSWLTKEEVLDKEKSLSDNVLGAMTIPNDGHVNPIHLTAAFCKSAIALGADVKEYVEAYEFHREGSKITGVVTNDGEFNSEHVIVTTGAWSKRLLEQSGLTINAHPVKGECISVLADKPIISSTIFATGCYVVPKSGNRLIIGATMIPNTFSEKVSVGGMLSLMEKATSLIPDIAKATFEKSWAGIRPQTGDELPFLGLHPQFSNMIIATGHYRNGILLAPITGETIANIVKGHELPKYMEAFKLNRLTVTT
ncbi:glycine oxidase ThiO [Bacillus sp. FJAT-45066]|uniref:glycine oxidase ThiO n=1 Tax=Bacillus sp. FJAT-45066 TaxID=2011010 RepID=UPI000BB67A26|nr:glycine oxidase ThiO [Bacillus sp. FJAT-45066]